MLTEINKAELNEYCCSLFMSINSFDTKWATRTYSHT